MDTADPTTNRFSLIEMDDKPRKAAPTPPPPKPTPGQVDATAKERAERDEETAKRAGFALAPPIYPIGSIVVDSSRYKARREAWERQMEGPRLLSRLRDRVWQEDRKDHNVEASRLEMKPDGKLGTKAGLPLTERAFQDLCDAVAPGGFKYLADCPPSLRATNINHWLKERGERELMLRTRKVRPPVEKANSYAFSGEVYESSTQPSEIWSVRGPKYAKHTTSTRSPSNSWTPCRPARAARSCTTGTARGSTPRGSPTCAASSPAPARSSRPA